MTDALSRVFADEWGRIVASLVRITGDWALAEDCAQDAFAAAAVAWPRDGVPTRPGAWLTTTARNRALDRLRRSATEARKLEEVVAMTADDERVEPDGVRDDRLRLIFTCCHPALDLDARVALTLRTLCGLTVEEIAAAFGTGDAAMAKRLVRARRKIQVAGIPYRVPSGAALPERLGGVLGVLLLLFTEGYAPSGGADVVRPELSAEAIRLGRVLAALLPAEPEVHALLALMLLQDSRRSARTAADGTLVPLAEQDRSRWDAGRIAEGRAALAVAERLPGAAGPHRLQARIAAEHARGPDADRGAIARHYGALSIVAPSPWVELARAVAVAEAEGPEAGLALLAPLRDDARLAAGHQLAATEAELLRRAGRREEARGATLRALERVRNTAERAHLERRLVELAD